MIKIIVNGSQLELKPNTTVKLHFQSPMFFDEGTYSLPISIANSINNRLVLNFPARVSNLSNAPVSYDCEIMANSFHLKGLLIVTSCSINTIEAYYTDGIGHFNYLAQNKNLTDIIDPDAPKFATLNEYFDYLFDTVNYTFPDRKFVAFPMRNMALWDKTKYETFWRNRFGVINDWDWQNNEFKNEVNEYNIPHFYLNHVLNRIFSTFGFTIGYNFFYNEIELRQLVMLSDIFKRLSAILIERYEVNNYKFDASYFLPQYLIKSLIADLRSYFFCEFFIDNRSKQVSIKSMKEVITSPEYTDITDIAGKNYEIDFDEKESGYDFTTEIDSDDSLMSDIIDLEKYHIAEDVETVALLPVYSTNMTEHENEVRLVKELNAFYVYYQDLTYGWKWAYMTDNFHPVKVGEGELIRRSATSYPKMMIYENQLMPHIEVTGFDLPDHPLKDSGGSFHFLVDGLIKNNTPKLVLWHGIVQMRISNPGSRFYPFASNNIYYKDDFGAYHKIAGKTLSLNMYGDNGIYNKFGNEFVYWWFNVRKSTKWRINWTTIDLHNLDYSRKYRIGNQNYLVKSVDATIEASGNLTVDDTYLELT